MSLTPKLIITAPHYAGIILCAIAVNACARANVNTVSKPTHEHDQIESSASEINKALATISADTAVSPADYQIGPEDLLQITLYNVSESEADLTPRTSSVRVSQEGVIALPLLGEIKVTSLTPRALETELRKRYAKYIYDPQVGVIVAEYRQRVSVMGAVQKAGVFDLTSPKTVIDMLALAGGVTELAGNQVHIYRRGSQGRESHVIDLLTLANNTTLINAHNANLITLPVKAGDIINVPTVGMFFVDGAVNTPGSYPLGRRYTLTQALSRAGGVDRELNSADVSIYRRTKHRDMEIISVNLDAIKSGDASDPIIEADDVIEVPISSGKYFVKRFIGQIILGGFNLNSLIPAASGS